MFNFVKTQRLLTKCDYDQVFADAKKLANQDFIFLFKENKSPVARLGLAISKKALAKSHDRNRIKRLVRESFRQRERSGFDVVVLAKKEVRQKNNQCLFNSLSKLWEKLG